MGLALSTSVLVVERYTKTEDTCWITFMAAILVSTATCVNYVGGHLLGDLILFSIGTLALLTNLQEMLVLPAATTHKYQICDQRLSLLTFYGKLDVIYLHFKTLQAFH